MIEKIVKWFNVKTGMRFWYAIKIAYLDKSGHKKFSLYGEQGYVNKRFSLNGRLQKIVYGFPDMIKKHPEFRDRLCNGKMVVTVECYLGYFKRRGKK